MNMSRPLLTLKRLLDSSGTTAPSDPAAAYAGMDRVIAPKPAWRRYAPWAAGALVIAAAATWALWGAGVIGDGMTIAGILTLNPALIAAGKVVSWGAAAGSGPRPCRG